MEDQMSAMLRGALLEICAGTAFLVIGLTSCGIAVLRRRNGARVLLWIGLWSAAYGLLHLLGARAVQLAVPLWMRAATPYVTTAILYLMLVFAACAWVELITGEVPRIRNLRISAAYQPAKSVAGDFYEFLPVDEEHAGFFVADVCGHGVPAALIASMLKVALQSAAEYADSPGQFLAALNRQLAEPLRGQLVTASYLWVDMRARKGLYSAAGHPPLLRWNKRLERIESNGLLFGILPETEYPVREVPLCPGDRLLLYTDGVTEPENSAGEAFGDCQLEQLLAPSRADGVSDVSQRIMAEVQAWQHAAEPQDDMTLIVIDVG